MTEKPKVMLDAEVNLRGFPSSDEGYDEGFTSQKENGCSSEVLDDRLSQNPSPLPFCKTLTGMSWYL